MAAPGYESNRFRIIINLWPAGPAPVLTESWDRFPSELVWSSTGDERMRVAPA